MKLLSLFSGIGAFEKALDRVHVPYELVNFCEFDKFASKSYCAIHGTPESLNLGDITKVDLTKLYKGQADMITYGFPCQDISLAGNKAGFEKDGKLTRSGLFFYAAAIIGRIQPKIAIAENVKALTSKRFTKEFKTVLDTLESLGYNNYWQVLNAKDYGVPQNRERVFIISIRKDIDNGKFEFPKPFPLELKLKDILEKEVDEKYYLSDAMVDYISAKNEKWTGNNNDAIVNKDCASTLTTGEGTRRCDSTNYLCDDLPDNADLQRTDSILIREKTKKGYSEAHDGNGVYINRPHQKRGVVQKDMIQTIKTAIDDIGVVVKESE